VLKDYQALTPSISMKSLSEIWEGIFLLLFMLAVG
jgi:hypothetical protein